MATCEVCGSNSSSKVISNIYFCAECFGKLSKIRSGDMDLASYYLSSRGTTCATRKASEYMYQQANIYASKVAEYDIAKRKEAEEEKQKQEFAQSFGEFYEYDVITAVNTLDGHTDASKLKEIIQEQARKGWKLHTIYSNELGKNAIGILGIAINSTACEDVMIFERRVEKNND